MSMRLLLGAALVAAAPASAQEAALRIDLIPGHPVHHEREKEAGVVMALSITPARDGATSLMELCEELRLAAGLGNEKGEELRLETIFVVPYKGMAVEGYYYPRDGTSPRNALVRGKDVARQVLNRFVTRAGIPPRILDEADVELQISCAPDEPLWFVAWHDVRPISNEEPEAVIERARQRFLAVHRSVVEHNATERRLQKAAKRG
jgi:hypothetical protein